MAGACLALGRRSLGCTPAEMEEDEEVGTGATFFQGISRERMARSQPTAPCARVAMAHGNEHVTH